jgi:glycosyltransferase involved in cell wall biosynthesis
MRNPDISIVITNFNRAKYLARAVRSCIGQFINQKTVEVIVVDDCSVDDSKEVLNEFEAEILFYSTHQNSGVSVASNLGLEKASGNYFLRVDADDFISNQACNFMSAILDSNQDIDFVYSDHIRIDEKTSRRERVRLDTLKVLYEHGAGIMFRKTALQRVGGYDQSLRNAEDFDLLIRLGKSGAKGFYLPIPLYRYYIHGENLTLSPERILAWEIVEKKYNVQFR